MFDFLREAIFLQAKMMFKQRIFLFNAIGVQTLGHDSPGGL